MNKKEVLELRKQFKPEDCSITRICGCYVDGEKEIKSQTKDAFLSLPEEEIFKYLNIFKQTLSEQSEKSAEHGISTGTRTLRWNTGISFAASRQ